MPTKGSSQFSNIDFLSTLNKYIPSLVLTQLIARQQKPQGQSSQLPELQPMTTVCLFADISGFTNVSEACAKKGVRGNEELAFCINRYMEGMVKNLGKYGGDIIKFVGDAMIVMWPPEPTTFQSSAESASLTVRKAIQCALDIQKDMNNFKVIAGVSSLSVKIGIGYGQCALLYVGGVFGRAEFFTVGPALTYALKSEENATAGGQIIVSESAYQHVRKFYLSEEIISDHGGEKFYRIIKLVGEGVKTRADALVLRSNISADTYIKIATQLRGCVPAAIIPYLQIGQEEFGSETRSLTVMFASLGVELSSAETTEGMAKIQKIVTTVQQQVYRHQGSVNKLVMDDKGSTLICLWGLTPMAHEDDASRAILTAFNMRKELKKIDGTWCNIGISSGELFSGVVGTSGGRKEFSVLGDIANLAARVMYWPKKFGQKGKIHVDLNTRALASNQFSFTYCGHQEFKGKSISIPIFEPMDPVDEQADITKKVLMPDVFLKPHMNPMCLERSTDSKKQKFKLVGPADSAVMDISIEIVDYFQQNNAQKPYLAAIKGEIGSGKTLFARCLIDELLVSDDFIDMMGGKMSIFCSSLNSESQFQFMNVWRPILQQMMSWYCKKDNLRREQVIEMLLGTGEGYERNQNKIQLMCLLLGVDYAYFEKNTESKQLQPNFRMFPFVMRENYEEKKQIVELMTNFVKIVIGEASDILSDDNSQNNLKRDDLSPILVILDSCHLMDGASWLLYEQIKEECNRIGIVLLQLCNEMGDIQIHQEAVQQFDQVWNSKGMQDIRLIELPALDQQTLLSLIKTMAPKYQQTYTDEISKMIEIVKPNDTIKTEEMGRQWKEILSKKWQVENKIVDVSPQHSDIIKVIVKRCTGNPLLSLYFLVSLLQNSFVMINNDGLLTSSQKFLHCVKLNDFITVPVPRFTIKYNLALIDKYLNTYYSKEKKKPGELETCVKSIVQMKAASVLGDEFDLKSLLAVNPLRLPESVESMKQQLKLLEAHDFIEILDESDKDNLICRFNKPFLRETLYQIVLYRDQKKGIHGAAAQYFLQNQMPALSGTHFLDPDIQAEVLKQHMITSQDIEVEGELSYQARTGLYVSRIKNILNKDENALIKKEYIYKQGKGANKKTSKRLVTINTQHFRWYHDEEEFKNHTFLGSVPIQYVFQTVASKMARGNMAAFSLSTSSWYNKQQQEEGMRDFFFACDTDLQMEDWIITIEFLRTKAVYDAYASKNIPVQFPLQTAQEKKHFEERKDWNSLLYDFGGQLKQNSQMRHNTLNNSSISPEKRAFNDKSRQSVFNQIANQSISNQQSAQFQVQEMVLGLKILYGVGILSFSHHLVQTSTKITVKQQAAHVGQIPDHAQQEICGDIAALLHDQSQYNSARADSQENRKSNTRLTDESKDDTQKNRGTNKKQSYTRRGSSISADNVAKKQEESQKYYNKNDQIHEETEGQTSDELIADSSKKKKEARKSDVVQSDLQKLQKADLPRSNGSDLAFLQKQSEESPSTTPPLSQKIMQNMHSPPPVDEVENRQTFNPRQKKKQQMTENEEIVELLNQDDRVDNLRSQAPSPKNHYRVQSMTDKSHTILQQAMKDENFLSQSTVKQPTMDEQQNSMMQSLQQLISQSIDKGMSQIIQHNQAVITNHKDELNQIMIHQQQIINQSILNRSNISYQDTPRRQNVNDLFTPQKYKMQHSLPVGGMTSIKSRRLNDSESKPLSKSMVSGFFEDDEEPLDPELSDHEQTKLLTQNRLMNPRNTQIYNQQSRNQNLQNKQRSDERISDQSMQTIKREEHFQVRADVYGKPTEKYSKRPPPVEQTLLNFQDEKLYFPPPDKWIANEYALYEEPIMKKKDMLLFEDPSKQQNFIEDEAVCIRDSYCQLKGKQFKVPEGGQVKILEHIPNINMYRLQYRGQSGLFAVKDFTKIIKRKMDQEYNRDHVLDQMSPIHPVESKNFFKEVPERALTHQMSKLTSGQIARTSQRILDDEKLELKQQNLKMIERQQKKLKKRKNN